MKILKARCVLPFCLPCILVLDACLQPSSVKDYVLSLSAYADPFIGTAYVGHTHPAAQLPFGMVQVGPDTGTDRWEHCSGYYDGDSTIIGFSHTHLSGTGCPDMGDIMLMPVTGKVSFERGSADDTSTGYRSRFSHASEAAAPGYYKVHLEDYGIRVELTATHRAGYHKYTYPEDGEAGLVVDMQHGIGDGTFESSLSLLNDTVMVGKRRSRGFVSDHTYYFYAVLSAPVRGVSSYADGVTGDARSVEGRHTKMILNFGPEAGRTITARVALSTTGVEGARKNLQAEVGNRSFEEIRTRATATWDEALGRIEMEPMNGEQRISFYTSLYHALLMPNLVSDTDGTHDVYTNFSLWDTYRATHPFYLLM